MTARDTLLAYANDWHHADCAGNFSPFAECSCELAEWVTKAEAEATAAAEQRLRDVRRALTDEDEIAHGEAWNPVVSSLMGVCAYCDGEWPCHTQRAINRLLALLDAPTPASPRQGEPVEGLREAAKALADFIENDLGTWFTDETQGTVGFTAADQRRLEALHDALLAALSEPAEAGEP